MSSKSTNEIRQAFLDFFCNKGHKIVPSSSLVPNNDPTLFFTNAGMNQFKNVFLGLEKINYSKVATAQRCVRAGGKHNDLENVGYTNRHHTFFEMLGNFSFGDYFKKDAIKYAWELLTSKKWFDLPEERFWITVHNSDDESYNIWHKEIGISSKRIIRIGDIQGIPYSSSNFWQMGDIGPCGPCTEIFYDYGEHIFGSPPNSKQNIGDRYIEIWNIVFMEYNRHADGNLTMLPNHAVDTGMGLERIVSVLQSVNSNYQIDLFRQLISYIAEIIDFSDLYNKSLLIIADHIRSSVFLISDGVFPSNEGSGYVLRRIIRRAVLHGYKLGVKKSFFYKLVKPLIKIMSAISHELKNKKNTIEIILKNEEEQFHKTLIRGLQLLDNELSKLNNNILSGKIAFRLYDTYGIPFDLIDDVCCERNIKFDKLGFNIFLEKQRFQARECNNFLADDNIIKVDFDSHFLGYENNKTNAIVKAIFCNGEFVNVLNKDQEGIIFLDKTVFYPESGGQIGDIGILENKDCKFLVTDTQKYAKAIGHIGKLNSGLISVNQLINAQINVTHRCAIQMNHSATHLLNAALRIVLGDHVIQKGSLVNNKYLRFDFSHFKALNLSEINKIEDLVNYQIRKNHLIMKTLMNINDAKKNGVIMFLNKQYDKEVRVLSIGDFSSELCVGTHVVRAGDIGLFRIKSECGMAAGVRRIEAITGQVAIDYVHRENNLLIDICEVLKCDKKNIIIKFKVILDTIKKLKMSLNVFEKQALIKEKEYLKKKVKIIKGINLLISQVNIIDVKKIRILVNEFKNQLKSAIIVFATTNNNKITLIVGVTKDLSIKIKANDLILFISKQIKGKGGGNYEIAESCGSNITALPTVLAAVEKWINLRL
ncbi:alanine--tRNA ligase [Arsenophonus symbiont of Ornithomya chloropus]|uniref:alanine--tRNA ligase n=1 Tax=Arsenophonus symbiont of Ornithomya chloropus TaxID=634121 RepID=UPI0032B30E07